MKQLLIIIFITTFLNISGFAQISKNKPSWIDFENRALSYNNDKYLVGFISETASSTESFYEAKDRLQSIARTELSELERFKQVYFSTAKLTLNFA